MTTQTATQGTDRFTRIWADIPSADRLVLLGHDRDELSDADKRKLARVAQAVALQRRRAGRRRSRG